MRRCVKCGHEDWGFIHYCPKCGTLFPGEKDMTLVGEDDYRQATKVFGCIEVEMKKWNEMKAFYRSHLSTGYAPKQYAEQVCHPDLIRVRSSKYSSSHNIYGLVDVKGNVILPCIYQDIRMFREDKAWIKRTDTEWICISSEGKKLGMLPLSDNYGKTYYPIGGFSCGLSPVCDRTAPYGSHIGYSNSKGEIVIPAKYGYYATSGIIKHPSFVGDSAFVSLNRKNGILRKNGTFELIGVING